MYLDAYFDAVDRVLARIRDTQREAIRKAAAVIAETLAGRGGLFVMDTGHMLRYECFRRAGGLVAFTPFSYTVAVESPLEHRSNEVSPERQAELEARSVALALDKSSLQRGDILIINSNSGRTPNVIEVALQCKERGIATIGISSSEQMTKCEAVHPSGQKLFDVTDICIDNCGPFGDAAVPVRDNEAMCPLSGLAATYILWAIQAEAVERLQAQGVQPTIFRSVHVGGAEHVEKQLQRFRDQGV